MSKTTIDTELQNVDENGVPVEVRMPSPIAMRSMFDDMVAADALSAATRAKIYGLYNGAKPFSDKQIKDSGESGRFNYNNRRSESVISPRNAADFSLVFDVDSLTRTNFQPGFFPDRRVAVAEGGKVSQAYTYAMRSCFRTVESACRAISDRNLSGLGFFFYPNIYDCRPKAILRDRVFFSPNAALDGENLNEFCVIDWLTLSDLFDLIDNQSASETVGWNIDNLKKALACFYFNQDQVADQFEDDPWQAWLELERRRRDHDTSVLSRQHEVFSFVRGYIKERTGKMSQYIITRDQIGDTANSCLLYTSPSPRDGLLSRMPSSA